LKNVTQFEWFCLRGLYSCVLNYPGAPQELFEVPGIVTGNQAWFTVAEGRHKEASRRGKVIPHRSGRTLIQDLNLGTGGHPLFPGDFLPGRISRRTDAFSLSAHGFLLNSTKISVTYDVYSHGKGGSPQTTLGEVHLRGKITARAHDP